MKTIIRCTEEERDKLIKRKCIEDLVEINRKEICEGEPNCEKCFEKHIEFEIIVED